MRQKKIYGVVALISTLIVVVGISGILYAKNKLKESKTEKEQTTAFECGCMSYYDKEVGYVNMKIEGVDRGAMSVATGNYIFSVFYEEFYDYSIKVYEAAGKETKYIKDISLKECLFGTVSAGNSFEVADVFSISDRLVVVCGIGTGLINVQKYEILCFDTRDIDNINLVYKTTLSKDYFEFFEKDGYMYAVGKKSVVSMNFAENPGIVDKYEIISDGRVEMYINQNNMYFITRDDESENELVVSRVEYADGNIDEVARTKVVGCLYDRSAAIIGVSNDDDMGIYEKDGKLSFIIRDHQKEKKYNAYVLDEKLEVIEQFENMTKREGLSQIGNTSELNDVWYDWFDEKSIKIGMYQGKVELTMNEESNEEGFVRLNESTSIGTLYRDKKALVDSERNIICVGVESYDIGSNGSEAGISYYIFSYEDGKFVKKAYVFYETYMPHVKYGSVDTSTDGMCIGNYYYVVNTGGEVSVISLEDFEITKVNAR